jgi:lycopene cyclase domain-containing protein
MQWTYVLLLFVTFVLPFAYTLIHRKYMWREYHYRPLLLTVGLAAIPFLLFDMLAVRAGWWRFNTENTLGVYVGNLPLEEILFLVIIPQSCMFIWVFLRRDDAWKNFVRVATHHYRKWRG